MRRLFAGLAEVERGGKPWRTRQQRILRRRQDTLVAGTEQGIDTALFASGWAFWALQSGAGEWPIGRTSPSSLFCFRVCYPYPFVT